MSDTTFITTEELIQYDWNKKTYVDLIFFFYLYHTCTRTKPSSAGLIAISLGQ